MTAAEGPERGDAFEAPLWRGVAVYRAAALAYAAIAFWRIDEQTVRPALGWAVLAAMAVWSVLVTGAYGRGRFRPWVVADLLVAVLAVLATEVVDSPARVEAGAQTLPVIWPAAAVVAWAMWRGPWAGVAAALSVGVAGVSVRGELAATTLHNTVLLLLAGAVIGWSVLLGRRSEAALLLSLEREAATLEREAATRERERLARAVHDGVLQVLALAARRGASTGDPDGAELGRLAAAQEVALRSLVSAGAAAVPSAGVVDVRGLLGPSGPSVTVSAPAEPVLLPAARAQELAAAVAAALDNVARHAPGANAWVLVEDEPSAVVVSVRDDGPGFAAGRLAEARTAGRLGVASSIQGRIADLGGSVVVRSEPGQGTELELRVPR